MVNNSIPLGTSDLDKSILPAPILVGIDTSISAVITMMIQTDTTGVINIPESDKVGEAKINCILVNDHGKLVGIITVMDLVRLISSGRDLVNLKSSDLMSKPVITLKKSEFTDVFVAIKILEDQHIHHLPVVDDDGELVGLITHESLDCLIQPFDLLKLRLVSELMTDDVIQSKTNTSLLDVALVMADYQISCVAITEEKIDQNNGININIPLGIITEQDIVKFKALDINLEKLSVTTAMSQPVLTIKPEDSLLTAHSIMQEHNIHRLLVVGDRGELLGIITQSSLLGILNPWQMYGLVNILQTQVTKLESEKIEILSNRNQQLELEQKKLQAEIRERQLLQQSLQKAEGELRAFFAAMTDVILLINREDRSIKIAPTKVENLSKYSTNILTDTLWEFNQGPRADIFWEKVNYTLSNQTVINFEYHLGNGKEDIWFSAKISPVSQIVAIWVARDITELKETETALKEIHNFLEERIKIRTTELQKMNQLLRQEIRERVLAEITLEKERNLAATILATAPTLVVVIDQSWRIVRFNLACEKLTGYSSEQVLGLELWDILILPSELEQVKNTFYQLLSSESTNQYEAYWVTKDGKRRLISWSNSLISNEEGNIEYFISTGIDISDSKAYEMQLIQQAEREKLLYQTALQIRCSLNLDEILNTTVCQVRKILKCDRVLVYQLNAVNGGVIVAESVGNGWKICLGKTFEDTCFTAERENYYLEKEAIVINNINRAELTECHREMLEELEVKATLIVPIATHVESPPPLQLRHHHLWGLLIAHQCSGERFWNEKELKLLQEIAVQLSIAIQQSELYQQVKTELQERKKVEIALKIFNEELEKIVKERTQTLTLTNQQLQQEIIERQQIQAALERQNQKSRLFAEIALKIRQSLDLNQILQTTVTEIHNILKCDRVLL